MSYLVIIWFFATPVSIDSLRRWTSRFIMEILSSFASSMQHGYGEKMMRSNILAVETNYIIGTNIGRWIKHHPRKCRTEHLDLKFDLYHC